jgi:hypothetical protein
MIGTETTNDESVDHLTLAIDQGPAVEQDTPPPPERHTPNASARIDALDLRSIRT